MTRSDILAEIEHRELMLKFTTRLINNPPKDDMSQMMVKQANRIKEEISRLKNLLKKSKNGEKKVNKRRRK